MAHYHLTKRRLKHLIPAAALAAAGGVFYSLIDPAATRFVPKCLFHSLTGLNCPGCGSQRMIHALLKGDLNEAWSSNPFLLCLTPILAAWIWIDADPSTYPRLARIVNSIWFICTMFSLILAWAVARNLFL